MRILSFALVSLTLLGSANAYVPKPIDTSKAPKKNYRPGGGGWSPSTGPSTTIIEKAAVEAVQSYVQAVAPEGSAAAAASPPKKNYLPFGGGGKKPSVVSAAMSNYLTALSSSTDSSSPPAAAAAAPTSTVSSSPPSIENENVALKQDVGKLQDEIATLKADISNLENQLASKTKECQEFEELAEIYNGLVEKTMAVLEKENQRKTLVY